ncbi:MAG TPA: AAA family ATPase [Acidimicrobiales bacterium]|nr:AAA family ATPase [Acidimicrobiales bacterium]
MNGPVVGREKELRLLCRWLDHVVCAGTSSILFVEGEAGIGKTRLVTEAAQAARDKGVQVLMGSAHEFEHTRPFAAISEAVGVERSSSDPERARIADLLSRDVPRPSITLTDGPNLHYLVSEGIVGLVEAMTTAGSVLLVLEDLHWADPSTVGMIAILARRLTHLPLAVLVSFRPIPRPPELERLLDVAVAARGRHLFLPPLNDDAIDALVVGVTGAAPGPQLRAQLGRAQGNPLYLLELLGALREQDSLTLVGDHVESSAPAVPPDLRVTILRRLTYLGAETVDVLQTASVLGTSLEVEHLGLLLGRSPVELLPALRQAVRAGVLREDGDRLAFRHDLVREAIYEDLPKGLRAGMHSQIGRALASVGAPAAVVAGHLRLGGRVGDREVVRWLQAAGVDALSRDPSIAAQLLQQAADLVLPGDPALDEILADLAQAHLWAGHVEEAEASARLLLGRAHDPALAGGLWTVLVLALLAQGRTVDADRAGKDALGRGELAGPMRARLQASVAQARVFVGDLNGVTAAAKDARAAGERDGDDLAVCIALCALSAVDCLRGHLADARAAASGAVDRAVRTRQAGHFPSHLFLGYMLTESDQVADTEVTLNLGRRLSEETGTVWSLPMYSFMLSWFRFVTGDWDDAIAEAEAGLALAAEVGTRHGTVVTCGILALVALHRNDLVAAEEALALGEAELTACGPGHRTHWLMWARALLAEAAGRPEQAVVDLEHAWDACTAMGACSEYPLLGPDLVRLCIARDQWDRSREVTHQVSVVAARMGTRWAEAAALRCRGLAEADGQLLERAVATARQSNRVLELALACEEAGTFHGVSDSNEEAIPLLVEALDLYESLGAIRDMRRVEAVLRAMGVQRARRGPRRRRPATGWEALTPTELEVARLVANGATNRQAAERLYKSVRTVETHVSHILQKLGVSSRSQLAALAIRQGAQASRISTPSARSVGTEGGARP